MRIVVEVGIVVDGAEVKRGHQGHDWQAITSTKHSHKALFEDGTLAKHIYVVVAGVMKWHPLMLDRR